MSETIYKAPDDWWVQHVIEEMSKFDKLAWIGIAPGTRVKVFDHTLYKNDTLTPLSVTMKSATVVKHYGELAHRYPINDLTLGPYESMIDVVFDHKPERESCGHFTWGVELLGKNNVNIRVDADSLDTLVR